jgi:hypothetical protein
MFCGAGREPIVQQKISLRERLLLAPLDRLIGCGWRKHGGIL